MQPFDRLESEVRGYVRSFSTVFTTAKANRMTGEDGRVYLDFFSGTGALNYGHNDEAMKKALLEYVESEGVTHGLDRAPAEHTGTFRGNNHAFVTAVAALDEY